MARPFIVLVVQEVARKALSGILCKLSEASEYGVAQAIPKGLVPEGEAERSKTKTERHYLMPNHERRAGL